MPAINIHVHVRPQGLSHPHSFLAGQKFLCLSSRDCHVGAIPSLSFLPMACHTHKESQGPITGRPTGYPNICPPTRDRRPASARPPFLPPLHRNHRNCDHENKVGDCVRGNLRERGERERERKEVELAVHSLPFQQGKVKSSCFGECWDHQLFRL